MTWVRLDDTITTHPKMAELGEDEFAAFISALCYCNQHLTDGVLPKNGLKSIRFLTQSRIKKLCAAGLFRLVGDQVVIHDYAEYQPTKAQVQAEKEAAKERQRKWRERHRNGVTNASANAVTNAAHPIPSHPYKPTVVEREGGSTPPHGRSSTEETPLPRGLERILDDRILRELKTDQRKLAAAAWEADSVEIRHSLAAAERAGNPTAYFISICRRIAPGAA